MSKAARCAVSLLMVILVAASIIVAPMMVSANDQAGNASGTENSGKIEALVWDDGIKYEVTDPFQEGVNEVRVNLYKSDGNGGWTLFSTKTTAQDEAVQGTPGYKYGYVCWSELPVDPSGITTYKLEIPEQQGVIVLNGNERIAELGWSNLWHRYYFQVTDEQGLQAFQIQADPGLIGPVANKGVIEAVVWDDDLLADKSEVALEGIDGLTVNLYSRASDGSWNLLGSQKTGAGGFTGLYMNGWVGWRDLPVIDEARCDTVYKLELVDTDSFEPLNGTERIAVLNSSNNHVRYFTMKDGGELPAFRINYTAPFPTENWGQIETVVWDDFVRTDVTEPKLEGVDGITVNLYKLDGEGNWQLFGSMKTGYGGFLWTIEHGWAGWKELPVVKDWRLFTYYKLQLVTDNTFNPLNGTERIIGLNWTNLYYRWHFELDEDSELRAFQIRSTTATISGIVWYDANADQVREWHEPVQANWTILLTDRYGRRIATTRTDARGYYQFRGLKPGTYKVWVAKKRSWKQVYPYYKLCTWPPFGYEKGHHVIRAEAGNYYVNNDFGMLSMHESIWATLYYGLWWVGLLQYQFQ